MLQKITIDSIFGGFAPIKYFPQKGQFTASIGIDPDMPIDDTVTGVSGMLRPTAMAKFSGTEVTGVPLWIIANPKTSNIYVYANDGKVHTVDSTFAMGTALNSGNALTTASGNGAEYYDNYAYFTTNTNVTRYGPLNGSPSLDQVYWGTTLSKTALVNTTYPSINSIVMPNHVMFRHTDNKLYFCDVVGNQGVLHYISTTKTTVEGDTNNGSSYNALDFPYGYWPTCISNSGTDLVVGLIEGSSTTTRQKPAKISIWDTTSASYTSISDIELADPIISAIKNVNGRVYIFSGGAGRGCRVSVLSSAYSVQEVAYLDDTYPPFQGAVDHILNRIAWGGATSYPETSASVFAYGSKIERAGKSVQNILKASSSGTAPLVTAVKYAQNQAMSKVQPIVGWTDGSAKGLDKLSTTYGVSVWRSEVFRVGRNFEIRQLIIQLGASLATNMTIVPKIYVDDESTSYTYKTINSTNFSGRTIEDFTVARGKNDFILELRWSGSVLCPVKLPISILLDVYERKN